jgi:preprotein translocase subunit SecG
MFLFLISLHVLVCVVLVVAVLLQSGKGGGLAGAFGGPGGAGQSFFGGRGAATFLSKATVVLGGLYFLSSVTLAFMTANQTSATRSLIQQEAQQQELPPPAALPQPGTGEPAPTGQQPGGGAPQGADPGGGQDPGSQPESPPAGGQSSGP